ncbi:MAG: SulP family inorganic anion transporter [Candidatus Palauibacterales bacterium]|nr:SulP family inorganic anion transporter [Candidatus Palauibacterales bacterium]MDP2483608.1 SulP family inorganic anion transporter [Candidatus Palauibacterales bacterium]
MIRLPTDLEPKLITVVREGYSRSDLVHDLQAGIVVGVVALPLAIAFGIASGVRPEQGLYTAIVAGLLISLLSGSRVQIGGPTGAFVVLVFSIVARFGYDGLAVATLMAGGLLVAMGLARLGAVIRFIPYPVTVGFTTGIAIIIGVSQVPDALGLSLSATPTAFFPRIAAYADGLQSLSPAALATCAGTVVILAVWPRVTKRIPGPLVAILLVTLTVQLFGINVETIGSRFGGVPTSLPSFRLPRVPVDVLPELVSPAVAIALLAGIESLLSAVVADGMTGRRHRANAELIAQGVSNIASPLFGGIPATGAIARTATNVKNGGRTPIAGIVHALTLLLILTTAGHWVGLVPMAALAGILFVVAYHMSELRVFLGLLRGPRSDVLVLLTTFGLTVLVDLTVAIQVGVVLAALLFMRRMAEVTEVRAVTDQLKDVERIGFEAENPDVVLPDGTEVFEIAGSFFFGAAQRFSEVLGEIHRKPRIVILRMREVFAMDATGLHALEKVHQRLAKHGVVMLLSGVRAQPLAAMVRSGALDRFGEENVLGSFREASVRAWEVTDQLPDNGSVTPASARGSEPHR